MSAEFDFDNIDEITEETAEIPAANAEIAEDAEIDLPDDEVETAKPKQSAAKPKQTKQSAAKPKQTKQSAAKPKQSEAKPKQTKPKNEAKFDIVQLINYLNVVYHNNFMFKRYPDNENEIKQHKTVIKLHEHEAIQTFQDIVNDYYASESYKKQKQYKTTIKVSETWDAITHSIFDFKLRGIMTAVNDNEISDKDGESLLMTHIIPQLGYDQNDKFNKENLKNAIVDFLKGDAINFKLFNNIFPHPINPNIKPKTDVKTKLINFYIQTRSNYHNEYLRSIYKNKNLDLFEIACDRIAKEVDNDEITKEFLQNFDYADKVVDGRIVPMEIPEKYKPFADIIKRARSEKSICAKYVNHYKLCIDQKLFTEENAIKYYAAYCKAVKVARETADRIVGMRNKSIEDFVKILIFAFTEASKLLKYNNSLVKFIKDFGGNTNIFTTKFRKLVSLMVQDPSIKVSFKGNTFVSDYEVREKQLEGEVVQIEQYAFATTYDKLAKIGLYVDVPDVKIVKHIRAGLGISIVDYIHEKAKETLPKTRDETKKMQRKVIYIAP